MVLNSFEEYINSGNRVAGEVLDTVSHIEEPGKLADKIASYIYMNPDSKQKLLESFHPYDRLENLEIILKEEIEILKLEEKISARVKEQVNKIQKEHYLREQIKAIQKELGEDESVTAEADELREKIEKGNIPKEVKEKALKEVKRL